MKMIECTSVNELQIGIPVEKITGFVSLAEDKHENWGKCFIATGADGADGGENGWYVAETYETLKQKLTEA